MQYKKYPEVVHETEDAYIATIWTGPNYYIGWFPKAELEAYANYAAEAGYPVTFEEALAQTHVDEMCFMCKTEDYSRELLDEWIQYFLEIDSKR